MGDRRDKFAFLSELYDEVLLCISQPITATQLIRQIDISIDQCTYLLATLVGNGLLCCLNPNARRSRLFWFTDHGKHYHQQLREHLRLQPISYDLPDIDWQLYGSCCFSHRSAVIKTLSHSMQPAQIKRKAVFLNSSLRMSANNVRDVIRFLKENDIVQPIRIRKKAHLQYELTEQGRHFRRLLMQVEVGE